MSKYLLLFLLFPICSCFASASCKDSTVPIRFESNKKKTIFHVYQELDEKTRNGIKAVLSADEQTKRYYGNGVADFGQKMSLPEKNESGTPNIMHYFTASDYRYSLSVLKIPKFDFFRYKDEYDYKIKYKDVWQYLVVFIDTKKSDSCSYKLPYDTPVDSFMFFMD